MGLKKFLISTLVLMSLFIIGVTTVLNKSVSPLKQARAETIALAEKQADLIEVDDFYWYNGNETYLTVTGKNSAEEGIIVIVQQEGGAVEVVDLAETYAKEEAIQKVAELEGPIRILEARIGLHEELPIWEISYRQENGRIGYTMLTLRTGEWIRTIKNI